jgi:nucleotide-binding universal stress UspA family protein
VLLLHVLPRPELATGEVPGLKAQHTAEDLQAYREEMAGLLAKMRDKASWAQVEPLLKEGDVATIITRTAEETPCDMIVMGTHGKSRIFQLMMGSVAAAVTRQATCPVVTVKVPVAQS